MLLGGSFRGGTPVAMIGLGSLGHNVDGTRYSRNAIQHGRLFGQGVSLPQGYNSLASVRMPIKTGSKISARLRGDGGIFAQLNAAIKASASIQANSSLSANSSLGLVGGATL